MLKPSFVGIAFLIIADMFWGLAFIIPRFLTGYSAAEITLGRYFVYGILSIVLLLSEKNKTFELNSNIVVKSLLFAFCGNVGYYFFLVLAINNVGAAIPALIVGMLPVSISLYGNWLNREFPFIKLLPPILVILGGTFILNYSSFNGFPNEAKNYYGIICSVIALGFWTWYGVANAHFLKNNPQISSKNWSSIVGIATLILLPFFLIVFQLTMPNTIAVSKIIGSFSTTWKFWLCSLILGFIVSWVSTVLWNKASSMLPVSLTGQLIVGETVFALFYSYLIDLRLPSLLELFGVIITIGGLLYSIRMISRLKRGD